LRFATGKPQPPLPQAQEPPGAASRIEAPLEEWLCALKTESCKVCRRLEQLGQATTCFCESTICSYWWPQSSQTYSYIGMVKTLLSHSRKKVPWAQLYQIGNRRGPRPVMFRKEFHIIAESLGQFLRMWVSGGVPTVSSDCGSTQLTP
jgi:hypothetical protein